VLVTASAMIVGVAAHGDPPPVFTGGLESGTVCRWSSSVPAGCVEGDTDVLPSRIDDVLTNPGIGFADFHFGWWCNLPPITYPPAECAQRVRAHWPTNYPDSATAYFRWHWRDLEPVRGQIDFDLIDVTMQSANELGERLSFRVMTIVEGGVGLPQWLIDAPYSVPGQWWDGTFWPDYRDPTLQAEHARFVAALGDRYNGHPALDHVDIGSVGCWGEWNTACLDGAGGIFEIFSPTTQADYQAILSAYSSLIDHYVDAFTEAPVVMLGLGYDWELETMLHAIRRGAGWRVDCWGDWGFWGSWTHMTHAYPDMIANATAAEPAFPSTWKHAPIQLEVCGTIPQWQAFGWSADPPDGEVYRTFQFALEQHASVLNGKFTEIPDVYVDAIDDLLRANGYRLALDRLNHASTVSPGQATTMITVWSNLGVAPSYLPMTLSYRLRSPTREVVFASREDIRSWLPGRRRAADTLAVPADLPPGVYAIDIAILDRPGTDPATHALPPLELGIAGRRPDGWYPVSQITVE
jgi:hypothetical protein